MRFKDKKVWITGASSGTGEALSYAFNKEGATVIITARRVEELNRVKSNCLFPENVHIAVMDMENHRQIIETSEIILQRFGTIDILFNNAGISQRSLATETDFSVDKRLMELNYFGPVLLTKCLLPMMIKRSSGHIVVMSSLTGKFGTPLRSAYAASKHALHGFFDSLRAEVHEHNIHVTIICSGYIKTNIAINALTEKGERQNNNDPGIQNGMLPEYFAKRALNAILINRQELTLGGKEKLGVYLKRFFPVWFSNIIRKQNVR
jgi:short-subunit dehydrogenase